MLDFSATGPQDYEASTSPIEEGKAWLEIANRGKNTTALSYAAFEFRLAIERIVLQYWSALAPGGVEEITFQSTRSYKSIKNQ